MEDAAVGVRCRVGKDRSSSRVDKELFSSKGITQIRSDRMMAFNDIFVKA
jgi:hypothetical protein